MERWKLQLSGRHELEGFDVTQNISLLKQRDFRAAGTA